MANLRILFLTIFLVFSLINISIISTEVKENPEENSSEVLENKDNEEEEFNQEDASGNVLDEDEGKNALKDLGFEGKEFLTNEEMKTLYNKVFLSKEFEDPQEKEFYEKLVADATKELPEKILSNEIRGYFEIQHLMKFIQESQMGEEEQNIPEDAKEDM